MLEWTEKKKFEVPHVFIMDDEYVTIYITTNPNILSSKPHLILINHIKMKTPFTKPWALIELTT